MDANSVSIYVFGDYPSFMRVKVITTSGDEDFGFVGSSADYLFRYPEADGDYVFLPPPLAIANSLTLTHKVCPTANELYVDDAVDMMEELPANVVKRVMRTATPDTRNLINQYLKYIHLMFYL